MNPQLHLESSSCSSTHRVSASQLAHNALPAFTPASAGCLKAYDLALQLPCTRNFANHQDLLNQIQNP